MNWMRISAIIFAIGMTAIVLLADINPAWFDFIKQIPGKDKAGHLVLMLWFSFFINGALECKSWHWHKISILYGSVILAVVMLIEETSQQFFAGRTFSGLDILANYTGIAIGDGLARWYQHYRNRQKDKPDAKFQNS